MTGQTTVHRVERIGIALYLLGLVFALWGATNRISAEKEHHTTEILLDAQALGQWRQTLKAAPGELEKRLTRDGIASVAVAELHLDDLAEEGRLVAQSGSEFALTLASGGLGVLEETDREALQASLQEESVGTYLLFRDPEFSQALLPQLQILFNQEVKTFAEGRILWLPVTEKALRPAGLGFDPLELKEFANQGFSIWLRPENRAGLTGQELDALFLAWSELPSVQGVIFGGPLNEALGYPDLLEQTARSLKKLSWKLGYIELSPTAQQDGIETLVRELPGQTVRVMAVSPPHQAKLSPFRVLGMYSLGARERNIRALYVRPFNVAGRPELDEEFVYALPDELKTAPGPASLFDPATTPKPPLISVLALCLGAGALALLLLSSLGLRVGGLWWGLLLVPCLGYGLASAVGKGVLFRCLLALAVGIAAPTWAFLKWVFPSVDQPERGSLAEGLKVLALTSLASLSAGLYLAALLSETTFLLGLDRFRGVKLLTLGTPVLIVCCFVLKRYSPAQLMEGLRSYVAVYQAILTGGILALFGLLFLRTGNDAGGAASDWERTLRVVLDQALGVRPRFKEFMVAHPAMVCTPLFAARVGFLPPLLLVLLAGIGQAGIVDTFAHVHTPLDVTLIRVGLGVVFGAIIGVIAGGLFSFLEPIARARLAERVSAK